MIHARAIPWGASVPKRCPRAKSLAPRGNFAYLVNAQFRTCLWPCVGRWASGQEAGQPPKESDLTFLAHAIGSRRRTGAPRSPRGTRLKATTERAFLVLPAQMPDHRRGLSFLPGVRNGSFSLIRTKAAIDVVPGSHSASSAHHRRFTSAVGSKVEMTARIREFLKQRKD